MTNARELLTDALYALEDLAADVQARGERFPYPATLDRLRHAVESPGCPICRHARTACVCEVDLGVLAEGA